MKVLIGSIIVVIIALFTTWLIASVFFKPVGNMVQKGTVKLKEKMEEKDE